MIMLQGNMEVQMQHGPANELAATVSFASPGATLGGTAVSEGGFSADPTLRSVLFLAVEPEDRATDAVRDTALDLGAQAKRPVLLLDLTTPGNRHHKAFAEANLLAPRRQPVGQGPTGFAILQFDQVRHTKLYVSRVSPDPSAFSDNTWVMIGQQGMERLHRLFGAIVIAGPELALSAGGLLLAASVDGVVLVLRSGSTSVSEAREMRDHVLRSGGRLMGTVLTGCSPRAARSFT